MKLYCMEYGHGESLLNTERSSIAWTRASLAPSIEHSSYHKMDPNEAVLHGHGPLLLRV